MHKSFTQETSQTKSFLILEQKLLCKSYKLTQLGLPTFLAPLLPRPPIQLASQNGVKFFQREYSNFHKILYHSREISVVFVICSFNASGKTFVVNGQRLSFMICVNWVKFRINTTQVCFCQICPKVRHFCFCPSLSIDMHQNKNAP